MSGTRRANEPAPIFRRRRPVQPATGNVTVVAKEKPQADTQVIDPVPPQPTEEIPAVTPSLAQEISEALDAAERGETEDLGSFAQYADVPIPDLDSADPADRTEWFRLNGGSEPLFASVVADLEAAYLLDTSLPVPVRTAPEAAEDTTDSGPGTPPAGEAAVSAAALPPVPGPVSTEDEPQDEPGAEADCGETGDVA